MVVGGAAGGATGGRKKKSKNKSADASASSSLTREEREEMLDAVIEKEVQKRMNQVKGKRLSKFQLSVEDAGQRVKIAKEQQPTLATLPKFELDIDCDVSDYINLLKDRRFHHRTRGSYPSAVELWQPHQWTLATPEKAEDRYTKGNFYRLGGAKREFPEEFFGNLNDVRGASESYQSVQVIAVYADVIKLMVQKVKKLTPERAKKFDPDLLPLVQLPIFAVCESERFPEAQSFTICNFYSSTPQHVTSKLEDLVRNWGRLSKLAFLIILAIIEFDMGLYNCRKSFNEARANLHFTLKACSSLELDFNGPDGLFSLKKLLGMGGCLHVLKFEFDDVIRIIMRARHDARGAITEIQAKLDVPTTSTSSDGRVEADDKKIQVKVSVPTTSISSVELAEADAKELQVKVKSSDERIEAETRVVMSDEAEWARWEQRRRASGKVMDLLLE